MVPACSCYSFPSTANFTLNNGAVVKHECGCDSLIPLQERLDSHVGQKPLSSASEVNWCFSCGPCVYSKITKGIWRVIIMWIVKLDIHKYLYSLWWLHAPSSTRPLCVMLLFVPRGKKKNLRWHLQICPFISPNKLMCLKTLTKTPFALRNDSPLRCIVIPKRQQLRHPLLTVGDYGIICANPHFTWYQTCMRGQEKATSLSLLLNECE